jgi:hypothetical protein
MLALITDSPVGKAIYEGLHDEDLSLIEAAIKYRRKQLAKDNGITSGATVRVKLDPSLGKWAGREGSVKSVNTKTVTLVGGTIGGRGLRISPKYLERI